MKITKFLISTIFLLLQNVYADSIKIGAILDQSGGGVALTVPIMNGMRMAHQDLPAEMQSKIEIYYEDDGLVPARSISSFQKLISENKVHLIVNGSSPTGNALAPLADRKQIPLIAVATDPAVEKNRKFVVNLWPTPQDEGQLICDEVERRGFKSIAIISTIHSAMNAFKSGFLNCNKVKVVYDEEVIPDTKDFRTIISRLNATSPEAIFINLFFGQVGLFAKQYREVGGKAAFFNIESAEDLEEVKVAAGGLEATFYAQCGTANQTFIDKYRTRFPGAQTFAAAHGYDIVMLIAEYLKQGGNSNSQSINHYLHKVKAFKGELGEISVSSDNRFNLPVELKEIRGSEFKKIR